ncbi:PEGA domain protein [Enhygromyxa salina]|uniref:PEGA domain protein n=1 Tax=Enhygromyxa salina TaxID=215803 RepID=A0A2S9YL86_9BACT|nr:PEGA domain-containing protein [Enhygromyxa salina]PRQ05875.1 PEGA domain protein [Enhygromyxa salina]
MIELWIAACLAFAPPVEAEAAERSEAEQPADSRPAYADELAPLPEAQRDEAAAELLKASAKTAFRDERFEEAIEFLAEAYRTYPDVRLLYSLGSAHRRAYDSDGDLEHRRLSIRRYQQYLSAAPDAEYAGLARNYLTSLLAERDLGGLEAEVVTRILVSTAAEDARMTLDGEAELPAPGVISVEPGAHEITVSAPGYHDFLRSFEVPEGATYQVQAELEEIDGVVRVEGPKGAWVRVDNTVVGQLPLTEVLRTVPGEHVVTVSKSGYEPFSKDIELGRDGTTTVEAVLNVSNRRFASYFLLGIGASGLIASGVLVGLTVDRQARARELGDKREADQLSTDEYQRYLDLVGERDSLRRGALISGIAGAALLVTGAVLFRYDNPTRGAGGRDLARVRVAPVFGPGSTGLMASLRF